MGAHHVAYGCCRVCCHLRPGVRPQQRHESWEGLESFVLAGVGGAGKSTAMRELRAKLEGEGKQTLYRYGLK